jgi:hypothetical protein
MALALRIWRSRCDMYASLARAPGTKYRNRWPCDRFMAACDVLTGGCSMPFVLQETKPLLRRDSEAATTPSMYVVRGLVLGSNDAGGRPGQQSAPIGAL